MQTNGVLAMQSITQKSLDKATLTSPIEPFNVAGKEAARLIGVSQPTWDRHTSAGKTPAPIKFGGRVLWRVAELRAWVEAGMPDRKVWEAMKQK
jgi:predicted DNA-binding transcriptional regulator AlpA